MGSHNAASVKSDQSFKKAIQQAIGDGKNAFDSGGKQSAGKENESGNSIAESPDISDPMYGIHNNHKHHKKSLPGITEETYAQADTIFSMLACANANVAPFPVLHGTQGIAISADHQLQSADPQQIVKDEFSIRPNIQTAANIEGKMENGLRQEVMQSRREDPHGTQQIKFAQHAEKNQQAQQMTAEKPNETAAKNPQMEAKLAESKEPATEFSGSSKQAAVFDADKVYVKVSDGDSLKSEKFASDLSEKIMTRFAEGKQQFEIELAPRELGRIIIKLVIEGGKAEIIMQCLNPKTQQLVMANSEAIRTIVENGTGMQTTVSTKEEAEFAYNDFDGQGDQNKQDEGDENQQRKLTLAEEDIETFIHQLRLGLTDEGQL